MTEARRIPITDIKRPSGDEIVLSGAGIVPIAFDPLGRMHLLLGQERIVSLYVLVGS